MINGMRILHLNDMEIPSLLLVVIIKMSFYFVAFQKPFQLFWKGYASGCFGILLTGGSVS